jgi:hypothetical protein
VALPLRRDPQRPPARRGRCGSSSGGQAADAPAEGLRLLPGKHALSAARETRKPQVVTCS